MTGPNSLLSDRTLLAAADGTELSVRVLGPETGPTFLLCDGIGCNGFVWRYIVRDFAQSCRLVHFHYRGHGDSAHPTDDATLSVEQFASDAWHVLDELGIDRVILWGHSMGVQVILEAAHQRPERVVALVPMCGAFEKPLTTFHDSGMAARALPAVSSLVFGQAQTVRDVWRKVVPTEAAYWIAIATEINVRMIEREDFLPYLDHLGKMDPVIFVRLLGQLTNHTTRPYLRHIKAPTLVFAGSRDRFTPPRLSRELVDSIDDAELCVIPQGSHTAPLELPDLVTLRAEKFLRQHAILP